MKIEYRVCDRCGEPIKRNSRLLATTIIPKVINILWIVTGIVSERKSELCGKCSDELDVFMYSKRKVPSGPTE